ncbi:hypothetical protein FORMB_14490 [Formosa sp. Hel1_33_131]|jgi:hypothetical protein|uniref:hypothetical protein n=1 Tax=Formosa sp. Hel1_33_131 TaxID=1336794 RepID=UPI00084E3068|nr:hypothetical protein [Formosa sp. Hel1_33_131]AOR28491.1 hypothetical protein FORMB_14490 [Formosa sp. Hel1_33_131]
MNSRLKTAGVNFTIAGTLLLASRMARILPILYNWHPEDIVTAAEVSLVFCILGFIILITAGSNLIKASK